MKGESQRTTIIAWLGRVEGPFEVETYEYLTAPNFSAGWFSPSELRQWSGDPDQTYSWIHPGILSTGLSW